ncbi:hypothetical protein R1flu_012550 [Riccia fluitans]|uniref:Reverse transcriptase domain-containing protein n=1 Tax=Riccia fluitans TaxID=41844 RepID=A0ABD1ZB65_9MARC
MAVYTKLIAARLALVLPVIVPIQQQAFVKGRSVLENVMLFTLVHEAFNREMRTASFLSVDFAKAFDSIHHHFIIDSLKAFDFSPLFVKLITSILKGAYARVMINSMFTLEFPLDRGVRQGCPLVPLLFVLVTSSLLYQVESLAEAGVPGRIRIRSVVVPAVSAIADDTRFYLQVLQSAFGRLFSLLESFRIISGCGVNWRKIKLVVIGKYKFPPD